MDRRDDDNPVDKQASQYDKILQENMEAALPGLIKNVLKINVVYAEELPDNLQYTKERKPDTLKKVTDDKGNIFVLHVEFQSANDPNMAYRMAEYLIMLSRLYNLEVRQYVIYIGEGEASMLNELRLGKSYLCYELISFSSIDYHLFLSSDKPEEKMLALLGDFGKDNPETVVAKVTGEVLQNAKGELERERRKNQIRILSQLRTLVFHNIKIMESISTFFKKENDFLYRIGEQEGIEKGLEIGMEKGKLSKIFEVALNAKQMGMAVSEISKLTGLTEEEINKL